ncbi:hypothetical protein D9619_004483 [Psilocybe cf. subviscida]|uniref:Uncharacterized protein n=1 Tax=Psilocybe cf. subviscida TaxID=2480587 RepID=A0A8H5F851_9AGAR|nr:hypothetical protein D9619_004483 [Psilocybe cf. subviscida]
MANPSSSATSPSPPALPLLSPTSTTHPDVPVDRDQRKRAVDKFLARAEIAMVTRALRARLSYASYKATHNIPHIPLRDLEAQALPHSQPIAAFSRSQAAKRKAVAALGTPRRGAMPPPSPRTGYATYQDTRTTPAPSSSLYASLLAPTPPPTHTARTVHNPSDPPVPAPVKQAPSPSPRVRVVKASPRHGKGKASVSASPAQQRKAAGKGKRKQHEDTSSIASGSRYADGDIDMDSVDDADPDMKAAATLTSLLMHHHRPPSMSAMGSPRGAVASPRASIDASHRQHGHTLSGQFTQSAARGESHLSVSSLGSAATGSHDHTRTLTPPPHAYHAHDASPRTHTLAASTSSFAPTHTANTSTSSAAGRPLTPGGSISVPAASDSEAANLMLFLATSPSPVRPSASKDARDAAAYRVLGGPSTGSGGPGGLVAKGRVLFSSNGESSGSPRATPVDASKHPPLGVGLRRGEGSANFSFGVSSLSPSMEGAGSGTSGNISGTNGGLLPPAPLPGKSTLPAPGSPLRTSAVPRTGVTTRLTSVPVPGPTNVGNTPGAEFNFSDFINSSPLPPPMGHHSQPIEEVPVERPGPITADTVAAYTASLNSAQPASALSPPQFQSQSQPQNLPSQPHSNASGQPPGLTSPKSMSGANGRNHGLRADVGRKLFEEEQMRYREREKEKSMHSLSANTSIAGAGTRGGVVAEPALTPMKDFAESTKAGTGPLPTSTLGAGIELSGA